MKHCNMKKMLSCALTAVMLVATMVVPSMATTTIQTSTVANNNGLVVSVDHDTECLYLEQLSSTEYNILCDRGDGYYPFNFSVILNDRELLNDTPTVTSASSDDTGYFSWAYRNEDVGDVNAATDTTTNYGLVVLPASHTSTFSIGGFTFHCLAPNGGTSTGTSNIYAYLPAAGQFTNEGITVGGWGDAYASDGSLKNNSATGVSLGYFGGYVVYKFDTPVYDTVDHEYGADFIVYGNAFWNNSEFGCIQVSQDGEHWYDIAGSEYYKTETNKNYWIEYTNPTPADDTNTVIQNNYGTKADVPYIDSESSSAGQSVLSNPFHKHSYFPLNCNYFQGRGSNAELSKVSTLPFATYTAATGTSAAKLKLEGVKLGGITGITTPSFTFGYADVHPNKSLGGTTPYNPYQSFVDNSDYNTKVSGTSGGDPIDIAWAVTKAGAPANLGNISYVRVYTGVEKMNGVFGEISTEVCGIAKCESSSNIAPTTYPTISIGSEMLTPSSSDGNCVFYDMSDSLMYHATAHITLPTDVTAIINGVKTNDIYVNNTIETDYVQIIVQSGNGVPFIAVVGF